MRVAVVGGGVSGCVAARILSSAHDVTLFEASNYAGGHANTVDVSVDGQDVKVDTGFMVFNRRTYPQFCRLLEILGARSQPSDMSFSVSCEAAEWEYQGSSLNGLFGQRRNLVRPRFWRMLGDIYRFNRLGTRFAAAPDALADTTVQGFLSQHRFGPSFLKFYLLPMASAIWSSRPNDILQFPAHFLIGFFANHGLLQVANRPQWLTVAGGSRSYVERLLAPIRDSVRLETAVQHVTHSDRGVVLHFAGGLEQRYDEVVLATHADQTLRLLSDATLEERHILGAFPYHENTAVLHTDLRMLPLRRRNWASWNYRRRHEDESVKVTYDLRRLQALPLRQPLLLTLNDAERVEPAKILRTFSYAHPGYTAKSVLAQRRWHEISGRRRTHFCGAYWGYGFHEDGVKSALAVSKHFGLGLEACTAASTKGMSPIAV